MNNPGENPTIDLSFLPEGFNLYLLGRMPSRNVTVAVAAPFYSPTEYGDGAVLEIPATKVFFIGDDGAVQEQEVVSASLFRDRGTKVITLRSGQIIELPAARHNKPPNLNGETLEIVRQ